jgi:hypothetical protein
MESSSTPHIANFDIEYDGPLCTAYRSDYKDLFSYADGYPRNYKQKNDRLDEIMGEGLTMPYWP